MVAACCMSLHAQKRIYIPEDLRGMDLQADTSKWSFKRSIETDDLTGKTTEMELKGSNVLRYHTEDGTAIIVRPSGTEPKVKVYVLTQGKDPAERDERVAKYAAWGETLRR